MTGKDYAKYRREHHSYVVRIWRDEPDGRWCFSVQDVSTGDRQGFVDLDSFLTFFYNLVGNPPNPGKTG